MQFTIPDGNNNSEESLNIFPWTNTISRSIVSIAFSNNKSDVFKTSVTCLTGLLTKLDTKIISKSTNILLCSELSKPFRRSVFEVQLAINCV